MNDSKPRALSHDKPIAVLYSMRTIALFAFFTTAFLIAPTLLNSLKSGGYEYGFPYAFASGSSAPPLPGEKYDGNRKFVPQALIANIVIYYAVAVLLTAGARAMRRAPQA